MASLRLSTSMLSTLLLAVLSMASLFRVQAKPWKLSDYDLCSSHRLEGIKAEASGVTYNPITNSIWVITRRPPVIGEYSMSGRLIRTISHEHAKFRDPEGAVLLLILIAPIEPHALLRRRHMISSATTNR